MSCALSRCKGGWWDEASLRTPGCGGGWFTLYDCEELEGPAAAVRLGHTQKVEVLVFGWDGGWVHRTE
jgi:hypothetical protein